MKLILLALTFIFVSCSSMDTPNRNPASIGEEAPKELKWKEWKLSQTEDVADVPEGWSEE